MDVVKIPDTKLVRDIHSKALLNTDRNALIEYQTKKTIAMKQQEEQNETKYRLAMLEESMKEIHILVKEIYNLRKP